MISFEKRHASCRNVSSPDYLLGAAIVHRAPDSPSSVRL